MSEPVRWFLTKFAAKTILIGSALTCNAVLLRNMAAHNEVVRNACVVDVGLA